MSTFLLITCILALLSFFTGVGTVLFTGFFGVGVSMFFWVTLFFVLVLWKLLLRGTKEKREDVAQDRK